jgi:hypothetical protein
VLFCSVLKQLLAAFASFLLLPHRHHHHFIPSDCPSSIEHSYPFYHHSTQPIGRHRTSITVGMRSTVILSGIAAIVSAAPAAPPASNGKASSESNAAANAPGFVPQGQDWYISLHASHHRYLANCFRSQAYRLRQDRQGRDRPLLLLPLPRSPSSLRTLKRLRVHLDRNMACRDERVHVVVTWTQDPVLHRE